MVSKLIPAMWQHQCDGCGLVNHSEHQFTPPNWAKVDVLIYPEATDKYDDGYSRLYCAQCASKTLKPLGGYAAPRLVDAL